MGVSAATAMEDDSDSVPVVYDSPLEPREELALSSGRSRLRRFGDEQEDEDVDSSRFWHFRVLLPALCRVETGAGCAFGARLESEPWRSRRERAVEYIFWYHGLYRLLPSTLFLAVRLLDQFLTKLQALPAQQPRQRHRLLAATALSIASKFEEEAVPDFASLAKHGSGEFRAEELHATELAMLARVDFRLHLPVAPHHLGWLLRLVDAGEEQWQYAEYLCELGLACPELPEWTPLRHAAAAVVLSSMMTNVEEWPAEFEAYCVGGSDESREAIMRTLFSLCRALHRTGAGFAAFDKWASSCRGGVALKVQKLVCNVLAWIFG